MSVHLPVSKDRDRLLRFPISDLRMWHLIAACSACRRERIVLVQSLVDRFGPDDTLLRLVPQLRCRACRGLPAGVTLRNRSPDQTGPRLVEARLV